MWELIRESLATLRGNLLRTILTMIGVILGVGAVVSIMSMGNSAYTTIRKEFVNSGISSLTLNNIRDTAPDLNHNTIAFLEAQNLTGVIKYKPKLTVSTQAVDRFSNEFHVYEVGATVETLSDDNLKMITGSFLTAYDDASRSQVVVIDDKVSKKFFYSYQESIGEKIRLDGQSYKVIGVYQSNEPFAPDRGVVFVPLSTLIDQNVGKSGYNSIEILLNETANAEDVQAQLKRVLMQQRGFSNEDYLDFMISNPQGQLQQIQQFFTVFSVFMSLIAAISLVVGGVGIMNIMLVTVTERTKEIGLLKALGAQKRDIIFQFLVESVVLTLFGGLLGVGLGILVSFSAIQIINLFDSFPDFSYGINYASIGVSLVVSILIGLIFGAYPAKRAADLDPVVALRRD